MDDLTVSLGVGDTATAIVDHLTHPDGSVMVLPALTTVAIHMFDAAGLLVVNAAGTVVDGATGTVKYQPIAADVDTPGEYIRRWIVTLPVGGGQESWPADRIGWPVVITDPTAAPWPVTPATQVCSLWCTPQDVAQLPEAEDAIDPQILDRAIAMASDVLYLLSGKQWPGVCVDTVRPCSQYKVFDPGPPSRAGMLGSRWWPGASTGLSAGSTASSRFGGWGFCSCNRDDTCGCVSLPAIELTGKRLIEILEVKIDGAVLDPSEYRIDDHRQLIRLPKADGTRPGWPCCQRLDLSDDEVGTFSVKFSYGGMPLAGGIASAASLSCQLALAMSPKLAGKCRLPKRVTTITRQNVTVAILDPLSLFKDGLTGLAEVDLWLASLRLGASRRPAMFGNPEQISGRPKHRRTG